jgi:hypothetical protein
MVILEADLLIPVHEKGSLTMFISTNKHSTIAAAAVVAVVVLSGRVSPAMASSNQNSPAHLTSHSPWLAPTGHRQPTRADAQNNVSATDSRQQDLNAELDRKLVICRGCEVIYSQEE